MKTDCPSGAAAMPPADTATGIVAVTARVVVSMIDPEPAVSPSVSVTCGVRRLSVKPIARGDDQQLVVSRTRLLRSLRLSSGHDTGLLFAASSVWAWAWHRDVCRPGG